MKIGDRVRIKVSLRVYHHPQHRQEGIDIQGMEGEIVNIVQDPEGRPISPNYPYEVKLADRFSVHLGADELELIS
ncbi:MAG: ferredoxin-thioredoxin reductase variable chain [Pseudanabaenaceae cyanobacterium]